MMSNPESLSDNPDRPLAGHQRAAANSAEKWSPSVSLDDLRAGQRALSGLLERLFDDLDHRRLQLAEHARSQRARRGPPAPDSATSREADHQIAALEQAFAAAQAQNAQRLAELAAARIELAATRIERAQAAAARGAPDDPAQQLLSEQLDALRSSADELAGEMAAARRKSIERRRVHNPALERIEVLLAQSDGGSADATPGESATGAP